MCLMLVRIDRIVGAPPLAPGTPGDAAGRGRVDPWGAVVAPRPRGRRLTAARDR